MKFIENCFICGFEYNSLNDKICNNCGIQLICNTQETKLDEKNENDCDSSYGFDNEDMGRSFIDF